MDRDRTTSASPVLLSYPQGAVSTGWHTRGHECQSRTLSLRSTTARSGTLGVMSLRVYLDEGRKRTFAAALDWPGWARSGKNGEAALEALEAYLPRYAVVVRRAGLEPPDALSGDAFDVVERVPGTGTTDFGALGDPPRADLAPLAPGEMARLADLVSAAWAVFDDVAAAAPAQLRKGPRGGGRDRDQVVAHVLNAEAGYVRKLGVKARQAAHNERPDVTWREELLAVLRSAPTGAPPAERGWPPRYAARRIAWHVLDHAWEIEDKSGPG